MTFLVCLNRSARRGKPVAGATFRVCVALHESRQRDSQPFNKELEKWGLSPGEIQSFRTLAEDELGIRPQREPLPEPEENHPRQRDEDFDY